MCSDVKYAHTHKLSDLFGDVKSCGLKGEAWRDWNKDDSYDYIGIEWLTDKYWLIIKDQN